MTAEQQAEIPSLPDLVADPRPVLGIGAAAFLAAGIAFIVLPGLNAVHAWTCAAGVLCGLAGWGVYEWQRAAVRRGANWVQEGV